MTTLQLYNADCLEQMKSIPDKSIDLIICDLPYGCLSNNGKPKITEEKMNQYGKGRIPSEPGGCAWDIKIDLDLFWKQIKRIRKTDATPCIHFCSTRFGIDLINSNEKEFRYDLVWCKSSAVGFLAANKKPMAAHEMIYVFSKKGANYNRIDIKGDFPAGGGGRSVSRFMPSINGLSNINSTTIGKRCPKSYIEIANKKEKNGHPTTKPIDLYKWLIERYSKEGDTVLDPTFGSCNSGRVCKELKRNYIGIEMKKEFFDKAQINVAGIVQKIEMD
jgi:site-specific DNA-methyltransferase (adenine-specific)